jgi:hypothetical protein
MNLRLLIFISVLLSCFLNSNEYFAQQLGSLRGFVTDSTNGEPISFANVFIKETNIGASSNSDGFFFIPAIPSGNRKVVISFIGYKPREVDVLVMDKKITELDVSLIPSSVELEELNVIGEKIVRQNETDIGLQTITTKEIEYTPISVESDIFKVIQASPGVSSTGDVTARYYVRGGAGDQNEVLLNGVTLYNPFHALGIFSSIDPEMISVLEFFKGGYEPKYGNRLSSTLNIVTKNGNKNKFSATGQASLLAGKVLLEGPIPNGSFVTTARKSYYSDILKKFLNEKEAPFDFYDLSFKVNYENPKFSKGGLFTLHGFYSNDFINNNDPLRENYLTQNLILGGIWRKVWSDPLYSVFNFSYSGYDAKVDPNFSDAKERFNNLTDVSLNFDFTYVYQSKDELQFGLQNKILSTLLEQENLNGGNTKFDQSGWDMSIYFNYKFYRWEKIGLDLGFRSRILGLSKNRPFIIEPRFSFTYLPNNLIAFKIAGGWYSQEVVTISNENELVSVYEPWIIVPDYLNAPQSLHLIAGIKSYITDFFTVELEGYYKSISNLFDVNTRKFTADFFDYDNLDGEAYGVDLLLKYNFNPFYLKTSYSLGWAYKIDGSNKFHPRYDRRHNVNVLFAIDFGAGWETSFTWNFASGMPFTPIAGFYDRLYNDENPPYQFTNYFIPSTIFGSKNTKRLPIYHRLDVSLSKDITTNLLDLTIGGSIVNVYDRKNIFYFDRKTGEQVNMLPILPSAFIKVKL